MTLEAVVYQQGHLDDHNEGNEDLYSLLLQNWGRDFNLPKQDDQDEDPINASLGYDVPINRSSEACQLINDHGQEQDEHSQWDHSVPSLSSKWGSTPATATATATSSLRPKRRRYMSRKNEVEVEQQRMNHIAVERNRRKQMNEYLSVLKSLMPDSYSQRGDQASIVGGAINVVKELEQNLHCLSAHKNIQMAHNHNSSFPFGEFFSSPQYSTTTNPTVLCGAASESPHIEASRVADIEVTMAERHANLKIRSIKRPKQLMKIVSGMQQMRLTILHLNVATVDRSALYSLSLKVEDDSQLNSAGEIATAVHQLLSEINEEASSS